MDWNGVVALAKTFYPQLEALVLFGSYGTEYQTADSDVDLAVLLPFADARLAGSLSASGARAALEGFTQRTVDLINLRNVSTVFQYEILSSGRVLFGADSEAFQRFEMYTLSFYQKLEEERAPILTDNVVLAKKESVERCVLLIRDYYSRPSPLPFEEDFLKQDAIAINLQRAAEQCIDLANHLVRVRKLGFPKESRQAFDLLEKAGLLTSQQGARLRGMVGFRNTLVHEYQELDLAIMKDVIANHLDDLIAFTNTALTF